MPRAKSITKKTVAKEMPEIMEFEDFVARKSSGAKKKNYFWVYLLLIALIIALSAFLVFGRQQKKPVAEAAYKIIYLDNNILYYAKIIKEDAFNIYLSDVYFIDTQTVEKPAVKEGDEPTTESVEVLRKREASGWLAVNRQKIFGFEDLPADSKVMEMIKSYK